MYLYYSLFFLKKKINKIINNIFKFKYICIILFISIFIVFNFNLFVFEPFEDNNPSIHVLIATIGKDSMFNMLDNLKKQLKENDYLTIVFDGPDLPNIDKVKQITTNFKCKTNVIVEETNLGYWGHGIRNKHNDLVGDFVFHIDDDDIITPDCINTIKNTCLDKNTVYIFKMQHTPDNIIWKTKEIKLGEIGTPMGLIPTKINPTSTFTHRYGGDYDFYKKLEENGNNIEYIDKVIYIVRP